MYFEEDFIDRSKPRFIVRPLKINPDLCSPANWPTKNETLPKIFSKKENKKRFNVVPPPMNVSSSLYMNPLPFIKHPTEKVYF